MLRFKGTLSIFFSDVFSNSCNSAVYRGGFVVVSMATMVTLMCHIVTLHVHCLCVILHMIFNLKSVRLLCKRL